MVNKPSNVTNKSNQLYSPAQEGLHYVNFSSPHLLPLKQQSLSHIDPYYGQNQTVQQGQTVHISCRVYNVGNR